MAGSAGLGFMKIVSYYKFLFIISLVYMSLFEAHFVWSDSTTKISICSSKELLEFANKTFSKNIQFNSKDLKLLTSERHSLYTYQMLNEDKLNTIYIVSLDSTPFCKDGRKGYGALYLNLTDDGKFINFRKADLHWGYNDENLRECYSTNGDTNCIEPDLFKRSYFSKNIKINFLRLKRDKTLNTELNKHFPIGSSFDEMKIEMLKAGTIYTKILEFDKAGNLYEYKKFTFDHPTLFPLIYTTTIISVEVNEDNKIKSIAGTVGQTGL
jgi:hypothetical protein